MSTTHLTAVAAVAFNRPVGRLTDGSVTFFAQDGNLAQVYCVRKDGRTVSTELTGVVYKSFRAGLADLERLNCAAKEPGR